MTRGCPGGMLLGWYGGGGRSVVDAKSEEDKMRVQLRESVAGGGGFRGGGG